MKRLPSMQKCILILMAVMLVASFSSLAYAADWPQFQKDSCNTGIYNSGTALATSGITTLSTYTEGGSPQFYGIDTTPIYNTTGGTGYTYVFPSKHVYEFNGNNNSLTQHSSVLAATNGGFQLSTPASDGSSVYVAVNDMLNQVQNSSFSNGFTNWTTEGSPTFTTGTVQGSTCAEMAVTGPASSSGDLLQTSVTIPSTTSVRLQYSYLLQYTSSPPTSSQIVVDVKPSSGSTWTTIDTETPSTYSSWVPVNFNVTNFPGTGAYDVRFKWNYGVARGSTATCCFTDCELVAQSFGVKKVTGLGSGALSLDSNFSGSLGTVEGQGNTPVKYYNDGTNSYLVVGQYYDSAAGSGHYFCLDPATGSVKWTFTPSPAADFYWAGAAVTKGVAIFGDDNGNVHVVLLNQSGTATEVDQVSGTPGIQPYDLSGATNEKVRSSICYYNTGGSTDYLYLTTRTDSNGYLYQLSYDPTNHVITGESSVPDNYSTSTPVRYDNYVFFGNSSGMCVSQITNGTLGNPTVISNGLFSPALGAVQSSPVVQKTGSVYNVYATENKANGRAFCINYNSSNNTSSLGWSTSSRNYVLQGLAAADGKLFFGDDSGYLYYLH